MTPVSEQLLVQVSKHHNHDSVVRVLYAYPECCDLITSCCEVMFNLHMHAYKQEDVIKNEARVSLERLARIV